MINRPGNVPLDWNKNQKYTVYSCNGSWSLQNGSGTPIVHDVIRYILVPSVLEMDSRIDLPNKPHLKIYNILELKNWRKLLK